MGVLCLDFLASAILAQVFKETIVVTRLPIASRDGIDLLSLLYHQLKTSPQLDWTQIYLFFN